MQARGGARVPTSAAAMSVVSSAERREPGLCRGPELPVEGAALLEAAAAPPTPSAASGGTSASPSAASASACAVASASAASAAVGSGFSTRGATRSSMRQSVSSVWPRAISEECCVAERFASSIRCIASTGWRARKAGEPRQSAARSSVGGGFSAVLSALSSDSISRRGKRESVGGICSSMLIAAAACVAGAKGPESSPCSESRNESPNSSWCESRQAISHAAPAPRSWISIDGAPR